MKSVMDAVREQPGMGHVSGADVDLVRRIIDNGLGWQRNEPRWAWVARLTGHGSGVSEAICRVVGVDPDETGGRKKR